MIDRCVTPWKRLELTLRRGDDDRSALGDVRHRSLGHEAIPTSALMTLVGSQSPVDVRLHRPIKLLRRDIHDIRDRVLRHIQHYLKNEWTDEP